MPHCEVEESFTYSGRCESPLFDFDTQFGDKFSKGDTIIDIEEPPLKSSLPLTYKKKEPQVNQDDHLKIVCEAKPEKDGRVDKEEFVIKLNVPFSCGNIKKEKHSFNVNSEHLNSIVSVITETSVEENKDEEEEDKYDPANPIDTFPKNEGKPHVKVYSFPLAMFIIIISTLMYSCVFGFVKYMDDINSYEKVFIRSVGIFVFNLPSSIKSYKFLWPKGQIVKMILGGLSSSSCLFFLFFSVKFLHVGGSQAMMLTISIIFLTFQYFRKNRGFSHEKIYILLFSVSGIIMNTKFVLFLLGHHTYTSDELYGFFVTLFAVITSVLCLRYNKQMKQVDITIVVFYYSVIGIFVSALMTTLLGEWVLPVGWKSWLIVLTFCIISYLGSFLLFKGAKGQSSGLCTAVRSVFNIIFSMLIQGVLFETVPDIWNIIGSILILISVLIVTVKRWLVENKMQNS